MPTSFPTSTPEPEERTARPPDPLAPGKRWTLAASAALALFLGLLSWSAQVRTEHRLQVENGHVLETILGITRQALVTYADEHCQSASVIAGNPEVRSRIHALVAAPPEDPAASADLRELRELLKPVLDAHGFVGFLVVSPDDTNVASSRDDDLGRHSVLAERPAFLARVRSGQPSMSTPQHSTVPLPSPDGEIAVGVPTLFVGAPVLDDRGEPIAVLALRLDPSGAFSELLRRGRVGQTGETYAFDRQGTLLSESRFDHELRQMGLIGPGQSAPLTVAIRVPGDPGGPPGERPLTLAAQSALDEGSGTSLEGYRDYRGVLVIGTWIWNDALDIGIVTELDASEAWATARSTRGSAILSAAATSLLVLGLGLLFERSRTQQRGLRQETRVREELEVQVRQQAHLVDQVHDAIISTDPDARIISWNRAARHIYGWSAAEALGRPIEALLQSDYVDGDPEEVREHLREEGGWSGEVIQRRRDGSLAHIHASISRIGEAGAAVTVNRDISRHRETEEALRRSEHQLKLVADALPDLVGYLDPAARLRSINTAFERFFGLSREALLGRPLGELFGERARPLLEPGIAEALGGKRANIELRQPDAGGSVRDLSVDLLPHEGEDGAVLGAYLLARDLTERRTLENALHQSQKMEAIGTLASGVAHDFNNLLMGIGGALEIALTNLDATSPIHRRLEEAKQAAASGAAVTRRLLDFGRKDGPGTGIVALDEVVARNEELLRRMLGEDIRLRFSLEAAGATICCDPGNIEQLLVNLVSNAKHAMPQGGSLDIETALVDPGPGALPVGLESGTYVRMRVTDTGTGMDEQTLRRIFEPFFTTKPPGKGTGLGLAMSYATVRRCGGHIAAASEPGSGTTFTVHLPLAAPAAAPAPAPSAEAVKGSVLVVEDDDLVRMTVRFFLEEGGLDVLEASSVSEARQILDDPSAAIDLVLTDMVLSDASGKEVAEAARAARPRVRIVYMSAYPRETLIEQGRLTDDTPTLQKPFDEASLLAAIRERMAGDRK